MIVDESGHRNRRHDEGGHVWFEREIWPEWIEWKEWDESGRPSPYGDPEQAMIFQLEQGILEQKQQARDDEGLALRSELNEITQNLVPADRVLMALRDRGATQEEIGDILGMRQASVCNRIRRIRRWATLCVPTRIRARGYFEPACWRGSIHREQVFRLIFWHHRTSKETADILRLSQSTVYHHWARGIQEIQAWCPPQFAQAVQVAAGDLGQWCRPPRELGKSQGRSSAVLTPDPAEEIIEMMELWSLVTTQA